MFLDKQNRPFMVKKTYVSFKIWMSELWRRISDALSGICFAFFKTPQTHKYVDMQSIGENNYVVPSACVHGSRRLTWLFELRVAGGNVLSPEVLCDDRAAKKRARYDS